ncbi:sensor histidine kinase YycG [bacterium BMS3Abin01]|nr:sensor histidine kinase YycG [bacterium BMS3Abin01]
MNAPYSIIVAVSVLTAVVLLTYVVRSRTERKKIVTCLQPGPEEGLVDAARRVGEQAALCDEIPRLKIRLDMLLKTSPLPMIIVNHECNIINLSHSAEQALDQPRRRRSLLESMESHELDDLVREALKSQTPADAVIRLYASGRRPFQIWLFPYRALETPECIIFLRDMAEKVDYGRMRSQFAATVSHELRTPLAGIRALVESLKDPELGGADRVRFLDRVENESTRLAQLIDELLFLSELESGSEQDLKGDIPLRSLVDEIIEELRPKTDRFEVQMENRIPPEARLPLEGRMARTVLTNMIENSVKYSGRGSRVQLLAEKENGKVKVTVRDDGIGIDAEHLPHIFERFYRVDKSRSKRLGGTGLGLSIVKHIIETAGGEVTADSREGFGTSISFTLPA